MAKSGASLKCIPNSVLDAASGADAIEIAGSYSRTIHLPLTDVVLPGMKGAAVIQGVLRVRPGITVLRMSG